MNNNNEKILYLEKLFEYISSHILRKNSIHLFYEKIQKIDKKSFYDEKGSDNLLKDELVIQYVSDTYEFIDSFLKNSDLQKDYDIYFESIKKHSNDFIKELLFMVKEDKGQLEHIKEIYSILFSNYFNENNEFNKYMLPIYINMYYEYLIDTTSKNEEERVLKSIIIGGGPMLSKIFQELKIKETNVIKYAYIINHVFENFSPITNPEYNLIKLYINNDENEKKDFKIGSILKIGSISQVHHTKIDDKECVIKFIKPRSLLYLFTELYMFINMHLTKPFSQKAFEYTCYKFYKIAMEFDFKQEFDNGKVLANIYNNSVISTIKMIDYKDSPLPYLIMSVGKGDSLISIINNDKLSDPKIKDKISESFKYLVHSWLSNMLVGSGDLHSDLHLGNILIDLEDKSSKTCKITIVDFGNTGKINCLEQKYIFKIFETHLSILNSIKNKKQVKENLYSDIIYAFSKIAKIDFDRIEEEYIRCILIENYELREIEALGDIIQDIISRSPNTGECMFGSIIDFGRGLCVLENSWKEIYVHESNLIDFYSSTILRYSPLILFRFVMKKMYYMWTGY